MFIHWAAAPSLLAAGRKWEAASADGPQREARLYLRKRMQMLCRESLSGGSEAVMRPPLLNHVLPPGTIARRLNYKDAPLSSTDGTTLLTKGAGKTTRALA